MTVDHTNKYLLNHAVSAMFALGRIAMPLFVFVLAYNLARPGALATGAYWRTVTRLGLYGALACVPFIGLGHVYGGWWPLNIMFTLLVATSVIRLMEHGGRLQTTLAVVVFIVGGGVVEYWWFAVTLAIVCYRYCKRPTVLRLAAVTASFASLWLVNQNPWAFAALPVILAAPRLQLSLPRMPLVFYTYYPAHLGILFVFSNLM
jgi:hypothetical protein